MKVMVNAVRETANVTLGSRGYETPVLQGMTAGHTFDLPESAVVTFRPDGRIYRADQAPVLVKRQGFCKYNSRSRQAGIVSQRGTYQCRLAADQPVYGFFGNDTGLQFRRIPKGTGVKVSQKRPWEACVEWEE
jgi:hypothetical protein